MVTKAKVKTEKADSRKNLDEAIRLYEEFTDYMLMDALDGKLDYTSDVDAAAAFSMADTKKLRKLADARKRKVKFTEADKATKGKEFQSDPAETIGKDKKGKTALEKRMDFLKGIPTTRLSARAAYDALTKEESPFG